MTFQTTSNSAVTTFREFIGTFRIDLNMLRRDQVKTATEYREGPLTGAALWLEPKSWVGYWVHAIEEEDDVFDAEILEVSPNGLMLLRLDLSR